MLTDRAFMGAGLLSSFRPQISLAAIVSTRGRFDLHISHKPFSQ